MKPSHNAFVLISIGFITFAIIGFMTCSEAPTDQGTAVQNAPRCFAAAFPKSTRLDSVVHDTNVVRDSVAFMPRDTIIFVGIIIANNGFTPARVKWLFGDGEGSDSSICRHYYTADSTYMARFTIFGRFGDSLSDTIKVTVRTSQDTTTIPKKPEVLVNPVAQSVLPGDTARFAVVATGIPAPAFQWQRNGSDVAGAVSTSYSFIAAKQDSGTLVRCIVRNSHGGDTSTAVLLSVVTKRTAPTIQTGPRDTVVTAGQKAVFSVSASGTTLMFQWYKDSIAIVGANGATLTLAGATTNSAGRYTVTVMNSADTIMSMPARLWVRPTTPTVLGVGTRTATSLVLAWRAALGATSYQVLRTDSGGMALTLLPSINDTTSTDSGLTEGKSYRYRLLAVNSDGISDTAGPLYVRTLAGPAIQTQPQNATVALGQAVSLVVIATGDPVPNYQWQHNGKPITGATSFAMSITSCSTLDSGEYRVVVTNSVRTVTSAPAYVRITALALSATCSPVAGGTIVKSKQTPDFLGDTIRVTASANPGYRFAGWTGDTTSSAASIVLRIYTSKSIIARFVRQFTLIANTSTGGTILPVGTMIVDSGSTQTVAATPDSTHRFLQWSGDTSGTSTSLSLLMIRDRTVTAQFKRQYGLTVGNYGGGTTLPAGTSRVDSGSTQSVTATATTGYRFVQWEGDVSAVTATASDTMNGNKSLSARFRRQYVLSTTVQGTGTVTAGTTVDSGAAFAISGNAVAPWGFYRWRTVSGAPIYSDTTLNSTNVILNAGNANIKGVFVTRFITTFSDPISAVKGFKVVVTPEGGYALGGNLQQLEACYLMVIRVNTDGTQQWMSQIGSSYMSWYRDWCSFQEDPISGDFLIGGSRANNQNVTRISKEGNVGWSIGTTFHPSCISPVKVDGTFLCAGTQTTDPNGSVAAAEWHKFVDGAAVGTSPALGVYTGITINDIATVSTGYVLAGQGSQAMVAWKLDANGGFTTSPTYFSGGLYPTGANAIAATADGGVILAGYRQTATDSSDFYLIKASSGMVTQWPYSTSMPGSQICYGVTSCADGGCVAVGTTVNAGITGLLMIKLNANGVEEWRKILSYPVGETQGRSIVQTSDGGFAICGFTNAIGTGGYNALLIKTDPNGNWQ